MDNLAYVEFSNSPKTIRVEGVLGMTLGYRLTKIRSTNRIIDMSDSNYFWCEDVKSLVSMNNKEFSAAKVLVVNREQQTYSLREKISADNRYQRTMKIDAAAVAYDANRQLGLAK